MGGAGGFGIPDEVGAWAQRYWGALGEALRSAGGAARPQDPWRAALDGWAQLAGGGSRGDAADAVERFSTQARQWLGAMQQVASQFAGQQAGAGDIAGAWKRAVGENPFAELASLMGGPGQTGFDQWYAQVAPMVAGLRQEGIGWLRMPAFGLHREHQERWQALAEAQLELQRRNDEYNALMLEANRDAFERFERKLAERSEPGRQLQSARALFDLWIDAAEEAYAEIALSKRFRTLYGALVDAQMRVRAGIQDEVERMGQLFGLPGRTEVDAAHRRIAELERQVRRLVQANHPRRQRTEQRSSTDAAAKPRVSGQATAKPPAAKPSAARTPAADEPASKPASKPAAKSAAKPAAKPASKPAAKPSARPAAKGTRVARAASAPAQRRAPRQAIAAIAMPEPLKPLSPNKGKPAKRTR
jgi:hypothetical protein